MPLAISSVRIIGRPPLSFSLRSRSAGLAPVSLSKINSSLTAAYSKIANVPLVLLVDDNPHDRRINRDALVYEGFEVIEAEDGTAALKALYGLHRAIVLLDVVMPGMDGWTARQRAPRRSDGPDTM